MNENSMSGWAGLEGSSPYSSDNANADQSQGMQNMVAGAGDYSTPPLGNYGGSVSPSPVNGYPMFSSQMAGQSTPSGYANTNPITSPMNATPQMGRAMPQQPVINPSAPVPANMNPWNISTSSSSGALDYPLGQNIPPTKLNVL